LQAEVSWISVFELVLALYCRWLTAQTTVVDVREARIVR